MTRTKICQNEKSRKPFTNNCYRCHIQVTTSENDQRKNISLFYFNVLTLYNWQRFSYTFIISPVYCFPLFCVFLSHNNEKKSILHRKENVIEKLAREFRDRGNLLNKFLPHFLKLIRFQLDSIPFNGYWDAPVEEPIYNIMCYIVSLHAFLILELTRKCISTFHIHEYIEKQ